MGRDINGLGTWHGRCSRHLGLEEPTSALAAFVLDCSNGRVGRSIGGTAAAERFCDSATSPGKAEAAQSAGIQSASATGLGSFQPVLDGSDLEFESRTMVSIITRILLLQE